ncbi:MAG: ATP--cob(I)alamin adenosyltransferase [Patescibacteria group bacterium]|nr:MAG: ATP--cob(I)alamin adenosyltransferase [Patescibacteria group bacterium]
MIYTKKGDRGKTSIIGNKRISKSDDLFWAIGDLDELNSLLGVIISKTNKKKLIIPLRKIQSNIFVIGSILAGYKTNFPSKMVKEMEAEIDKFESKLPVQTNFIFPGGIFEASMLFFARSVARRAERRVVVLKTRLGTNLDDILIYLNRLSDYLFILARWLNFKAGKKEDFWKI